MENTWLEFFEISVIAETFFINNFVINQCHYYNHKFNKVLSIYAERARIETPCDFKSMHSRAGLGNVRPTGHIRPAKHLNVARELH
jgi:hypothetical protein